MAAPYTDVSPKPTIRTTLRTPEDSRGRWSSTAKATLCYGAARQATALVSTFVCTPLACSDVLHCMPHAVGAGLAEASPTYPKRWLLPIYFRYASGFWRAPGWQVVWVVLDGWDGMGGMGWDGRDGIRSLGVFRYKLSRLKPVQTSWTRLRLRSP